MSLHGLLEAWGPTGSPYDLNEDKTVNVTDLIQFLLEYPSGTGDASGVESMSGSGIAADAPTLSKAPKIDVSPPESIPAPPTAPTNPLADLKGLFEAWGQTDSPFDVNQDKNVNVTDLIQFLLDYPTTSSTPETEAVMSITSSRNRRTRSPLPRRKARAPWTVFSPRGGSPRRPTTSTAMPRSTCRI